MPKGINDGNGEFGFGAFKRAMLSTTLTRAQLKDMPVNNAMIGRRIIHLEKDPDVPAVTIDTIDPGEYDFDMDVVKSWEQNYTNTIGYSSAVFTSLDGAQELARKLSDMNCAKALEIISEQKAKQPSTNRLATKLLQVRGGKDYTSWSVEWLPPPVNRLNIQKLGESVGEKMDSLTKIMDVLKEAIPEIEQDESLKSSINKIIIKGLFENDKYLGDFEGILEKAKKLVSIEKAKENIETE